MISIGWTRPFALRTILPALASNTDSIPGTRVLMNPHFSR